MFAYAKEQLNLLQKPDQEGTMDQVMVIIGKRQLLLKNLYQLDSENKSLREQAINELKISAFNLSQLERKLDAEQFQNLKEILNWLENVYNNICEVDRQNELLMRKSLKPSRQPSSHISNKEATNAYQQVMKLHKGQDK